MRYRLLTVALLALLFPPAAFARGHFDPTTEFEQHEWVPIHLGPLNLSITKAVVYLMIGTALTILLGIVLMRIRRWRRPANRRGTVGEQIYRSHRSRSRSRGCRRRRSAAGPRTSRRSSSSFSSSTSSGSSVAATGEVVRSPDVGIYAATSSLSVTLALASLTFVSRMSRDSWNGRCATSRAGTQRLRRRCCS